MAKRLLFWGPVLTASGYGEHARQLLKSVLDSNQFDVSVCNTKWGQTPFLMDNEELTCKIRELVQKYETEKQVGMKYDVAIQVTIPNEFQKLATVNIGVTAGIEVDRVSPEWIKKVNDVVDFVVVPSRHSAQAFGVSYQTQDGGTLQIQKPVLVAAEGFDDAVFNTTSPLEVKPLELKSEFNFLSVGLGFDKNFGEDRKNLGNLVKWFCETFAGDERVGLVLKTSIVNNSLMDFETVKSRIQQVKAASNCGEFPRIQLVHGRMTKKELAALYRHPKVKAYVSTTHGEGYGLPIIEAAACGLPVIATNWSGHLDFLQLPDGKKRFVPVDVDLVEIPKSAVWPGVMEQGTRWANVKEDHFKTQIKKVSLSLDKPKEWATELAASLAKTHSQDKLGKQFVETLVKFIGDRLDAPALSPASQKAKLREQLQIPEGKKTLLFTMPGSAGDVFISSAVIDSLKKKFPDHLFCFATEVKYSSIVKDNPNLFRVIAFDNWMTNVPFCETVFDEVYTPNLAVQLNTSNWVRGGKGRLLGNELAAQCCVEFGEYFIRTEKVEDLPEEYIVLHTGSGKGQHEARNYRHWKKVVKNLQKNITYPIVQVGSDDEPSFEGVIDLKGKTTYNQLASVIQNALFLVGIDSVSMHMAAAFETPHVSIFGSSYASSTGPVIKKEALRSSSILIDTPYRMGCEKACYKFQCSVDRESPCVNEIDPKYIVSEVMTGLGDGVRAKNLHNGWDECRPKIAGYTHILNPKTHGYPFVQSIKSMLGFCDEVVVVDGGSKDGSVEVLRELNDDRIKIFTREWDWNEPGMDGMQKAYGRAMVSVGTDDFLWQQDADEVVHEEDYEKVLKLVERFPNDADLIHLPVVELWGDDKTVRTDRHSWKWRLSRNNFRVSHGINKDARVFDDKTGRTYAKKGMSDGCEYVDIMTNEFIPHKGFYSKELDMVRQLNPENYGKQMNEIFKNLPSVYHYSWANLPRKIRNFKEFWNKCWSNLYNEATPTDRFPNVLCDADVVKLADELKSRGGEHGTAKTFTLERTNPVLMQEWIEYARNDNGHLRNDQEPTRPVEEVSNITVQEHGQEAVSTNGNP